MLDPFGTTKDALTDYRTGFNPLALMQPDSVVENAGLIADALVVAAGRDATQWMGGGVKSLQIRAQGPAGVSKFYRSGRNRQGGEVWVIITPSKAA